MEETGLLEPGFFCVWRYVVNVVRLIVDGVKTVGKGWCSIASVAYPPSHPVSDVDVDEDGHVVSVLLIAIKWVCYLGLDRCYVFRLQNVI